MSTSYRRLRKLYPRLNTEVPGSSSLPPRFQLEPCNGSTTLKLQSIESIRQGIEDAEKNLEILLRAFDLCLHSESATDTYVGLGDSSNGLCDQTSVLDSGAGSHVVEARKSTEDGRNFVQPASDLFTPWVGAPTSRPSENPYLSTPMRLKHFPALSPSVLRRILSSPPLRVETPDTSIDISVCATCCATCLEFLVPCQDCFPPTPPPSVQLPALDYFLSPGDANGHVEQAHAFDCALALSSTLSSNRSLREPFLSNHNAPEKQIEVKGKPLGSTRSFAYEPKQNPMAVSPTVVQNFTHVIDELRGIAGSQQLQRSQDVSATLDAEFNALLLERACEEEGQAGLLHDLAARLDRLARARRRLAIKTQMTS